MEEEDNVPYQYEPEFTPSSCCRERGRERGGVEREEHKKDREDQPLWELPLRPTEDECKYMPLIFLVRPRVLI